MSPGPEALGKNLNNNDDDKSNNNNAEGSPIRLKRLSGRAFHEHRQTRIPGGAVGLIQLLRREGASVLL